MRIIQPKLQCQVKGCSNPSIYTPVFIIFPPDECNYVGPGLRAGSSLGICESHRLFFIEHSALDVLKQTEDLVMRSGLAVDRNKSIFKMEKISESSKAGKVG